MRSPSFKRRTGVFVLALAATLAVSASASAGRYAYTSIERGGIACHTASPNVAAWGAQLTNYDPNPQNLWCPLDTSDQAAAGPEFTSVWVNVSPGWATTSSCTVSILSQANRGWFLGGTGNETVAHNPQTNTDVVTISQGFPWLTSTVGAAVTCTLPYGATLYDYHERVPLYFDWTDW